MLGWIFKKKGPVPATAAVAAASALPIAAPPAATVDWTARLAQARGDDQALLALLRTAGLPLASKQAAVEALDTEAALVLAERELRGRDRRVHQLAKRRLLAKSGRRQTRERAAQLIETAQRLAGEADMPANRGVELDHAWQALDAEAIEPAQRDEFAALTAQLAALLRQRADAELQRKRWQQQAAQAVRQLRAACVEAAAGSQDRASLADAAAEARRVAEAVLPADAATPDAPAALAALAELQLALVAAAALDEQLAVLERLLNAPADATPDPADDAQPAWQALAPLPDPRLAALLQERHARWQQAREQAHRAQLSQRREQVRERERGLKDGQRAALADGVAAAEAALEGGQLADAQRLLGEIEDELQGHDVPDALHVRIAAAQARLAQLHGWQHWAGGRARDELVLQAEALAAATVAGGAGQDGGDARPASEADTEVARLSVRQRAEVIASLRARWKDIDRLGGATARSLWQRFDAALKAAHEPVAAHAAAQRASREANLSARLQLLDALEAGCKAADTEPAAAPVAAQSWAAALDRFQVEWRKLGPLEHTVPRAAGAAVAARMEAAVRSVQLPLQAARQQARAEREALVAQARMLAGDRPGHERDLVGEVRALQAEWQQHAKALPLGRRDEQALWSDFKGAIDAAFAAREAVFSAREAEFETHAAERLALIERLRIRAEDSAATQRRTLAEVEAAWQRCGPAPRARAPALDAEFRAARDTLRQWLDSAAQRLWQATCDALDSKLALCLAQEQNVLHGAGDAAATALAWQALPSLPAALEDALRQRVGLAPAGGTGTALPVDELLLQIETAWDLPTPPGFESARRERKLLAMKTALEGRRAAAAETLPPDACLARLLGRSSMDVGQHDRLAAVLAAWRRRGPAR